MEEKFTCQTIPGYNRYLPTKQSYIQFGLIFLAMLFFGKTNGQYQWDGDNIYGNFSYSENWYSNAQPAWGIASLPGDYFRSRQTGNWNVPGNWESSFDGSTNWVTSTLVPDQNAAGITIQNTHIITLTADATARKLRIDAGGTLDNTNTSGGYLLTIVDDGSAASDFDINGTYILYGRQPSLASNVIVTVYNGGTVRADNNYSPGQSDDFAREVKVNWQTGALFDWNTTNSFETSGETYFPNAGASDIAIFRISKTVIVGGGSDTYFNGLVQVNANSTFQQGGNKIFRNGICGNATLTQDGSINNPGNFQITGNNAILGGNNLTLNLTDIFNVNSNVQVPTDSVVTIIKSSGNATSGSISKASGIVFTVNGTADMTIINMNNGTGSVDINGTLRTASTEGLIGNGTSTVTSGTINISSGSTVEYYATVNQKVSTTSQLSGNKYYNLTLSGDNVKTPSNTNPIIIDDVGSLKIAGPSTLIVDATSNNIGPNNTTNTASFTMDGGRLKFGTLGFTGSGTLPSMKGTYNVTGGTIEFLGGTASTSQSIRSGTDYNYYNIDVSGPYVKTSGGNVNIKDGGHFIVNNGGVFTINANSITGVNTPSSVLVQVKSGGIFNSANIGGFNGRAPASIGDTTSSVHANITNIQLDPGSNINYSRDNSLAGEGSQPITNAYGLQYQNLTLSGTGNKIAPSNTLVIKGDFTKTTASVFVHNSGTVEFANNTSQSYSSVAPYPVFYNLINNNSTMLDVNSPLSVKNLLALKDNSKVNIDGDITLVSDNNGTASIDQIPEGTNAATITYGTGSFIVERYIPNHPRAWQLLSVPTKGSTIYESWQNSKSALPFRGINITDNRANWSTNGFDKMSYSPSMKYYIPGSDSFVGVDKTSDPLDLYSGYFVFVRGDRSATDIGSPSTEVTLHTKGKIYAPTPSGETPAIITVLPNSFALIGNPYASAINYDDLTMSSNIQVAYYIWDPQLTTFPSVYGLGAFRTITGNTSIPSSGNYTDGAIPPIQSGQAFFVYNPSASTGTVSFTENAKTTGSNSIFKTKKEIPAPLAMISANLLLNSNGITTLLDGTKQLFNRNYADETDRLDAKKIMNGSENIFLPSITYPLAIERKTPPQNTDTTFLNLTGLGKRSYTIQFRTSGLDRAGVHAILNDRFTSTQETLQEGSNEYEFEGNDDMNSTAHDRFFLTFKTIPPPFSFKEECIVTKTEWVDLKWQTISGDLASKYTITFGTDSNQLVPLKTIVADAADQYTWTHYQPIEGTQYYRITATLKDASIVNSRILKSEIHFPSASISIFPNPVTEYANLKLTRQPEGKYMIRLLQSDGKLIFSKYIMHTNSATHRIEMKEYAAGIYYIELTGPGNLNHREKIIIRR